MKAYILKKFGPAESLKISEIEKPEPAPGQVRVKIKTIGLNYAEILSRKGIYSWAPKRPYTPGMECFGTIDAVGKNVKRKIGEKVIVGGQFGSYAEYIVADEYLALKAIPGYSDSEQAAVLVNFLAAYVGLFEMARIRPSDSVLVTSAAGGVGSAAVKLAVALGCKTAGASGGKEKIVRSLGANLAVDYRERDWQERLGKKFPTGFDVVLEMVGGKIYKGCVDMLRAPGKIVIIGISSIDFSKMNPLTWPKALKALPRFNLQDMIQRSYGVSSVHLGHMMHRKEKLLDMWADLSKFIRKHKLKPLVGKEFSFEELPEAHKYLESRKSHGKVVIKVS